MVIVNFLVIIMTISRNQMRMLMLSIIISIIVYGVISFWAGFNSIITSFQSVGLYGVIIIFGLSFLNYLLRFLRWNCYINVTHKQAVPIIRHFIIYISGFSLTTTPAKAGEAIRGIFLKHYGIDFKTNIACFFTERLSDLLAIIILCLIGFSQYHQYSIAVAIGSGLIAIMLGFIIYPQVIVTLQNFSQPNTKIYNVLNYIYDILLRTKIYHKPVIFFKTLVISIIAWSCEAYGFYYMIHLLGYDIAILQAVFIYAIAMLIGGISFVPAGLGTSEAVMIALLTIGHIPLKIAIVMTIFTRIATLWFAVIIGLICLTIQSKSITDK